MPQGITTSFDLHALPHSTTCGLDFTRPPTYPQQTCGFRARQPTVARGPSTRQDNTHEAAMQPLFGMMVDGSAQILKISARAARIRSMFCVLTARRTGDIRKSHTAPKFVQSCHACAKLFLVGMSVCAVVKID